MAEVKATSVCYLKLRLRELAGDVERAFLERLPPGVAHHYLEALPLSWVPVEAAGSIYEHGAPLLFPGNTLAIWQLGYETALTSYTGIYRMLLRVASVPLIIERAERLWRNHHTDGDITTESTDVGLVTMSVSNYPVLAEPLRELVAGYIAALCALTGAKNASVRRDDRQPTWRWIVSWSER
jgi:hypothetical protein